MTEHELNEARELKARIRSVSARLNALRAAAENLTPRLDGMPRSQARVSRPEKLAGLITDAEAELYDLQVLFDDACVRLIDALIAAPLEVEERAVMMLRYVGCMTFRQIEFELELSDARIFYLHRCAIRKIKVDSSIDM